MPTGCIQKFTSAHEFCHVREREAFARVFPQDRLHRSTDAIPFIPPVHFAARAEAECSVISVMAQLAAFFLAALAVAVIGRPVACRPSVRPSAWPARFLFRGAHALSPPPPSPRILTQFVASLHRRRRRHQRRHQSRSIDAFRCVPPANRGQVAAAAASHPKTGLEGQPLDEGTLARWDSADADVAVLTHSDSRPPLQSDNLNFPTERERN